MSVTLKSEWTFDVIVSRQRLIHYTGCKWQWTGIKWLSGCPGFNQNTRMVGIATQPLPDARVWPSVWGQWIRLRLYCRHRG